MIDFIHFENVADYGDALDFLATGVSRMYMLSPHIVRIQFVQRRMRHDDRQEQRVIAQMECDVSELPAIISIMQQGLAALQEKPAQAAGPMPATLMAH